MIIDFNLTELEFSDRLGTFRRTRGCSLIGKIEFDEKVNKLSEIINASQSQTIGELYKDDEVFRYCCDRALELNNLDPDWINEVMLMQLLFQYQGKPGLLIQLNQRPAKGGAKAEGKATIPQVLAALHASTQDLEKAYRLANDYPYKDVVRALELSGKKTKKFPQSSGSRDPRSRESKRNFDMLHQIRMKTARNRA